MCWQRMLVDGLGMVKVSFTLRKDLGRDGPVVHGY
jgi:hypothetical protein